MTKRAKRLTRKEKISMTPEERIAYELSRPLNNPMSQEELRALENRRKATDEPISQLGEALKNCRIKEMLYVNDEDQAMAKKLKSIESLSLGKFTTSKGTSNTAPDSLEGPMTIKRLSSMMDDVLSRQGVVNPSEFTVEQFEAAMRKMMDEGNE